MTKVFEFVKNKKTMQCTIPNVGVSPFENIARRFIELNSKISLPKAVWGVKCCKKGVILG
jgi:hypothetical protein